MPSPFIQIFSSASCSFHLIHNILADWMVAFRVVIPLYTVMALSQFITYLLILIVGEKENKIKEGMKIMGLRDSVFW
jgi:ATP-binding cassette subfamily A (ABC1) protein 5